MVGLQEKWNLEKSAFGALGTNTLNFANPGRVVAGKRFQIIFEGLVHATAIIVVDHKFRYRPGLVLHTFSTHSTLAPYRILHKNIHISRTLIPA
jgi:hypothetical protein